ncbi:MAG TPA: hydrogenase maturation protease [Gemmata sp.]|nr:hydrogenase maturation protease [Gemmata sp.]
MRPILIAGVGNIFRGDDAFGVEVVRRLLTRAVPSGVRVADFGIRGHDLAYAVLDGYDAVILVDAVGRGEKPGTLYLLELQPNDQPLPAPAVGGHGVDLPNVFHLIRALGVACPPVYLVGCEPEELGPDDEGVIGLSKPVAAALDPAVRRIEALVADLLARSGRA